MARAGQALAARRTRLFRLAAVALAAAVGGCGGADRSGMELFTQDCGVCHSLSGRQSAHRQGGDLLDLDTGRQAMLEFVREMPVRQHLDAVQQRAVVAYVLAVESARRRRNG